MCSFVVVMKLGPSVLPPGSPRLGGIALCCRHRGESPELLNATTIGTVRWQLAISRSIRLYRLNMLCGQTTILCHKLRRRAVSALGLLEQKPVIHLAERSHVSSLIRRLSETRAPQSAVRQGSQPIRGGTLSETGGRMRRSLRHPGFLFSSCLLFC